MICKNEMQNSENEFYCVLLDKKIDTGLCYDVNMVVCGLIKTDAVNENINRDKGIGICENCPHFQLK